MIITIIDNLSNFCDSTGVWTQGLNALAIQAFCHLNHGLLTFFCFIYFFSKGPTHMGSHYFYSGLTSDHNPPYNSQEAVITGMCQHSWPLVEKGFHQFFTQSGFELRSFWPLPLKWQDYRHSLPYITYWIFNTSFFSSNSYYCMHNFKIIDVCIIKTLLIKWD